MTESEITIQTLIRILTRRWKPVVGFSVLVLVLVYLASLALQKSQYTSTVKLLVSKSKVSQRNMPVDNTMMEPDTFVHLIKSRDSLQRALEELKLSSPPLNMKVRSLESAVTVRQLRNTDLLELAVTLPDAAKAMELANYLADLAIEKNFALLGRESDQSRNMFRDEVELAHQRLKEAAGRLSEFMKNSKTAPSLDYFKSAQEALWKLKQDRSFNVSTRDESKARMETLARILQQEDPVRLLRRTVSDDQDLFKLSEEKAPEIKIKDLVNVKQVDHGTGRKVTVAYHRKCYGF